jgi:hypothetical protein
MGPSDPGSATERASAAPSTFSVVIPAFNEEEAIRLVLERVLSLRARLADVGIDGPEVIVVDDGSSDRTAEIAGGMPDVQVIRHATNRGYGAALKSGIGAARGDLIAFLDADGTYPPEHFPDLCRAVLRGADVAVGSRMGGGTLNGMPLARRIGNRAFGALVTLLGTGRVRDSASGMRVLRRAALERLDPLPDGLNFTPIMSLRAMHEGLQLVEVPIPYAERVGASKLRVVRDGLRYLHSIVWTALGYNPVRVCGGLGLLGVLTALLVFVGLATVRASGVTVLGPVGVAAVFVALVAGVGGVSLFCLGATFNYLLALLRREPIRYGIFGAPLFARPLERHFGWVGLLLTVAGAGGAAVSLLLGSYGWSIERLWLYLVGSALVILVGGQLVVSWILMQVLGEVSARRLGVR